LMTEESIDIYGKIYTLSDICKEPDEYIRLAAASEGFALKQLINDKSALVRSTIARIKYGHEQLATDESWKVRATVAKHCKPKLLICMINDEHHFVRYVIAKRGFHLEHFVNDPDEEIADLARYELKKPC
ncbi:MAG: hypothetical protein GQ529_00800, partial [Methyloprofundus sp.]|nr:hypothetical protein [Methyloprofundus sp.]